MNINYCQMSFIAIASICLVACGSEDTDNICTNHDAVHSEHIDNVVRVEIDYSASTRLVAAVSVPDALRSTAKKAALRNSKQVLRVESRESCQHDSVRVAEENKRTVYRYQIGCGADVDIEHVDTDIMDLIPGTPELDVSITSPAVTKSFVLHRSCSSPIYTYL